MDRRTTTRSNKKVQVKKVFNHIHILVDLALDLTASHLQIKIILQNAD